MSLITAVKGVILIALLVANILIILSPIPFLFFAVLTASVFFVIFLTTGIARLMAPLTIRIALKTGGIPSKNTLVKTDYKVEKLLTLKGFIEIAFIPITMPIGIASIVSGYIKVTSMEIITPLLLLAMTSSLTIFIPLAFVSYTPYRIFVRENKELRRMGDTLWRFLSSISGFGAIYRLIDAIIDTNPLNVKLLVLITAFVGTLPMMAGMIVFIRYLLGNSIIYTTKKLTVYITKRNIPYIVFSEISQNILPDRSLSIL